MTKVFQGLELSRGTVLPEWIDVNGHMNVAYYVLAFDLGIDALWIRFGITDEHIQTNRTSSFAVESHIMYRQELREHDPFVITSQILAFDEKRIYQYLRMYHADNEFLSATVEWMSLHVDMRTRRVAPWPANILQNIHDVADAQRGWLVPDDVGRIMRVAKPLYSTESAG